MSYILTALSSKSKLMMIPNQGNLPLALVLDQGNLVLVRLLLQVLPRLSLAMPNCFSPASSTSP